MDILSHGEKGFEILNVSEEELERIWQCVLLIQSLPATLVAINSPNGGMMDTFTKQEFIEALVHNLENHRSDDVLKF